MKKWLFALLFVTACSATPAQTTVAPGTSNKPYPWKWTPLGTPSIKLEETVGKFKTPVDVSAWLIDNKKWEDDYDIYEFISPNQFVDGHKSVCTGFARFWQYAMAKQGVKADFIAMYGPSWGHAIAVFRSPTDHRYHLGSNQYYYGESGQDLDPGNEGRWVAIQNAVNLFLGDKALKFEVYDENGNFMTPAVLKEGVKQDVIPNSPSNKYFVVNY